MNARRAWAIGALLSIAGVVVVLVVLLVTDPARLVLGAALLAVAAVAALFGLSRGGTQRIVADLVAVLAFVGAVALVLVFGHPLEDVALVALAVVAVTSIRQALRPDVHLPPAQRPAHPVMIWNAKSGGGKAVANDLPDQARRRGIEPVELTAGTDLAALVEQAVAGGADAVAAAGGDGTQAIVAGIAARYGLPFACIPAGTRNHFALDLGVDRDDVVGALDALVDGGERVVDLAEVNGRTFVNNCSLGVYAEAVQRKEYRGAKIRTLLATATAALGPSDDVQLDLTWAGPDGSPETGAAVILVSNNVYRLGSRVGSGTRPRLDAGVLGIAVVRAPGAESPDPRSLFAQWSTPAFTVESSAEVHAGLDGEALTLRQPVTFTMRPAALRVRIARHHPGASPSAVQPDTVAGTVGLLWRLATGARIEGLS